MLPLFEPMCTVVKPVADRLEPAALQPCGLSQVVPPSVCCCCDSHSVISGSSELVNAHRIRAAVITLKKRISLDNAKGQANSNHSLQLHCKTQCT